jgi:hypothetical protein
MKRLYLFSLLFLFSLHSVWSQMKPGDWAYHLSLNNTSKVVEADQKIYFLSEGGIYYFNKKDNSIGTLNKIDDLSGSDFLGISYNESTKCLIVTYKNSCIDIIRPDGSIYPILDIKRKTILGDKQIYNAVNRGNLCYLACGFGIVVVDLEKLEIKDSYIIGNEGNNTPVYDVEFTDDSIFACTKDGIKCAPLNGKNLLDYSSWKSDENSLIGSYEYYNLLEKGWNRLWTISRENWWTCITFSRKEPGVWNREFDDYFVVRDFKIEYDILVLCAEKSVELFNEQLEKTVKIESYSFTPKGTEINPLSAIIDEQGVVWIADQKFGGIRYENGISTQLTPEGPFSNQVFSLTYSDNQLWTTSGGFDISWGNLWFDFNVNHLNDGSWEALNRFNGRVGDIYRDAIQVLPFPGEPNHYYVASWGFGMLEFKDGNLYKVWDNTNSTLQNAVPEGGPYVRVGGMAFDSKGSLWLSNSNVGKNLHELKPDGTWKGYTLPEISNQYLTGKVLVTQSDNIWVVVPHIQTKGLYVMSNDGANKLQLDVKSAFSNGEDEKITDMNDVYSIVEDKEGAIWVGTSTGIAVYSNPDKVFEESPFYASQPGLDLNDGFYHPLLENITVTAIAVDGGNRKWCGTKSDGLFLISSDGQHELEHFTTENSELISDNITSLALDGVTGKLYIGTQNGLVSYQTDSKDSYDKFDKVYAYPNPVRENYRGNIYITGLMYETNVKITTVSGRLVFETTSVGGQAVWDGNDLAGNRVHTGIYLAYCASSDGAQSTVTKILFIR